MAKNYVQEGDVLDFIAAANLLSGAVVLLGKRIGIALGDVANGASGQAAMTGVYSVAKLSTDVVGQGDLLYWDADDFRLTTTVGSNTLAGFAAAAAGNGVATVSIKINA